MPTLTAGRFAAATSILALAVAMGGTGYAAVKVSGHQIKNGTISGKKIRNDSLSGADIREASLAKVPNAGTADSATRAGSVGGLTPSTVVYRSKLATPQTLFTGGGLSIEAACADDGHSLVLVARTSTKASIYASLVDLEGPRLFPYDNEGETFEPGETYDLTGNAPEADLDPALITFEYDTPAGRVVTGTLATDADNDNKNTGICAVTGHVLAS